MKYCCDMMTQDMKQSCDVHADRFDCPDALFIQDGDGKFGMIIHDGGHSFIKVKYCPWCGQRLKKQQRKSS